MLDSARSWSVMDWIFLTGVLALLGALVAVDVSIGAGFASAWNSGRYHEVPGVVTAAADETPPGGPGRVQFEYAYAVNGQPYTSSARTVGFVMLHSTRGLIRDYPLGTPVAVHYNPDDPGEAVLEPGVLPVHGLTLLAVPLINSPFLIVLGIWLTRRRSRFDPTNRRQVTQTATGWVVWPRWHVAPGVFVGALVCSSMLCLMIGLMAFGESIGWAAVAILGAILVGFPVWLARWCASRQRVEVDEVAGTISVSRTAFPAVIPFAAVRQLAAVTRTYSDLESSVTHNLCEATWTDGTETRVTQLVSLGSEGAVAAFIDWLRKQPALAGVPVTTYEE